MKSLPVYILAGGKSNRFGSDKARAQIDGRPLIVRVADHIAPFASRITVVADVEQKYADLGLQTIADEVVDVGPMGGLLTALNDLRDDESWLLLLSCDLVEINTHVIDLLIEHCDSDVRAGALYTDRWQPMIGIYHRTLLPQVNQRLAAGDRAMWRLLEAASAVRVQSLNTPGSYLQINSQDDLAKFLCNREI